MTAVIQARDDSDLILDISRRQASQVLLTEWLWGEQKIGSTGDFKVFDLSNWKDG